VPLDGFAQQLAAYCGYVFFMALNGVTEAFATAAADRARVASASLHLLGAGCVTALVASAAVPRFGLPVGITIASCANMATRTASSLVFIAFLLRVRGRAAGVRSLADVLRRAAPSPWSVAAFAPAVAASAAARDALDDGSTGGLFAALGAGGAIACTLVAVCCVLERESIRSLLSALRGRRKQQ